MRYESTLYTTTNEAGEQQVEIVYKETFLQWLFCLPTKKQVFVGSGTVWYEKGSGKRAGTRKEYKIVNIVEFHRQQKKYGY